MASYPYARVGHVLGMDFPRYGSYSHSSTTTPTTISGSKGHSIQSYELTIGYRDNQGRGWWVHEGRNSPTTNRHIGALKSVLEHNGYKPTDELRDDAAGMGRFITRRLWVKS